MWVNMGECMVYKCLKFSGELCSDIESISTILSAT